MQPIKLSLLGWLLALSGCATMNPYVQHSRNVSQDNLRACTAAAVADQALTYACTMAIRMEKARAETISTRSALTATIFPLVGIIGYNSARGFNAPTNAALTAGGFAGYSAITTLAQPDRIRIYDNGLRSTYCAIGAYQTALAGTEPEAAPRMALATEAARIRFNITQYLSKAGDPKVEAQLNILLSVVTSIENWIEASNPNRTIGSQLLGFVRDAVAKVNSQLTLTVPDNKQIVGDALSTLQAGQGGAGRAGPFGFAPMSLPSRDYSKAKTPLDYLLEDVAGLLQMYNQLGGAGAVNLTQLNFDDCAYAELNDIGVKDSIARFMLGPNDGYNGRTFTVNRGGDFPATISGGVLPYTATHSVKEKGDDKIVLTLTGGDLKISIPPRKGAIDSGSYTIIVNDATNRYAKWFQLDVPASND